MVTDREGRVLRRHGQLVQDHGLPSKRGDVRKCLSVFKGVWGCLWFELRQIPSNRPGSRPSRTGRGTSSAQPTAHEGRSVGSVRGIWALGAFGLRDWGIWAVGVV